MPYSSVEDIRGMALLSTWMYCSCLLSASSSVTSGAQSDGSELLSAPAGAGAAPASPLALVGGGDCEGRPVRSSASCAWRLHIASHRTGAHGALRAEDKATQAVAGCPMCIDVHTVGATSAGQEGFNQHHPEQHARDDIPLLPCFLLLLLSGGVAAPPSYHHTALVTSSMQPWMKHASATNIHNMWKTYR